MRDIIKMTVALCIICSTSGFLMASVKYATADRIESQVLAYIKGPALEKVLSGYDNNPITDRQRLEAPGTNQQVTVFPAKKIGEVKEIAIEIFGKGYAGDIGVMVGFDITTDRLTGICITTLKETPGFGMRILEEEFTGQFRNHPLEGLQFASENGDIDAISGATCSSTGALSAVRQAAGVYASLKNRISKIFAATPSGI